MKVLFICRANAGRSQMAEAYYNAFTGTHDATSAGVDLANSVKGDDPSVPDLVVQVMREDGYDLSQVRRKTLTKEMVDAADRVIVITDYPMPDYLEQSGKMTRWADIPDAVRTPLAFHRQVRDLVQEHVKTLI